jgi:putative ABC transport system permease protein
MILAYLAERPFAAALQVLLLALGAGTACALLLFSTQTEQRLAKDAAGVELVVGSKGSGLQLVLSGVFHADAPLGNIALSQANAIIADPRVRAAEAINLGDNVGSFRMVGAQASILDFYGAQIASGAPYAAPFEAVLGARAAERLALDIGATFVSAHGLGAGGAAHNEKIYTVTGILKPTGTVVDRLAFTPLESVWDSHPSPLSAKPEASRHDHAHGGEHDDNRAVTAVLIRGKTPIATLQMKREINEKSPVMAARPADEMSRLFSLVGVGVDAFRAFAFVLIGAAALSVFAALLGALRDRRGDIALLRAMGATRTTVFSILFGQGLLIAAVGALLGLALGRAAIEALAAFSPQARDFGLTGAAFVEEEFWIVAGCLLAGALAALIPALQAYRADVIKGLAESP